MALRRILALLVVLVSLWAPVGSSWAADQPKAAAALSIPAIAAQSNPAVVGIVVRQKPGDDHKSHLASGSGFVYRVDASGKAPVTYVVTNAHVVEDADSIQVRWSDGTIASVAPDSAWVDEDADVAILAFAGNRVKPLPLAGDGLVRVGEVAVAIGNPLGFRLANSVSVGTISGLNRYLGTGYPFLQSDVAVNPGNSGGPLLNDRGQVVGLINSKMVAINTGGLSFAIPTNVFRTVADTLIEQHAIAHVWLGAALAESGEVEVGLPAAGTGLTVVGLVYGSPARAALQLGDTLLKMDEIPVNSLDDVAQALHAINPGDQVRLTVSRIIGKNKPIEVTARVTLPARPADHRKLEVALPKVTAHLWRYMNNRLVAISHEGVAQLAAGGSAKGIPNQSVATDAPTASAPAEPIRQGHNVTGLMNATNPSVVGITAILPPRRNGGATYLMAGSGFVYASNDSGIDGDVIVVTSAQLVAGANKIQVRLFNGDVIDASPEKVATDTESDIAILRFPVPGQIKLQPLVLADAGLAKVGETVAAVTSPLGFRLGNSINVGVISGLNRLVGHGYPLIQTDVAVNLGGMGGPLVNDRGQVLGMMTTRIADIGLEGLSFAIPTATLKPIVEQLQVTTTIERSWLGVSLTMDEEALFGLPATQGMIVKGVSTRGVAVGVLEMGDRLLRLNGQPVNTLDDVTAILRGFAPGKTVELTFSRPNASGRVVERTATVQLVARPLDAPSLEYVADDPTRRIWTHLNDEQLAVAKDYVDYWSDLNFADFTDAWWRQYPNGNTVVFLQTEFMQVAYRMWQQKHYTGKAADEAFIQKVRAAADGKLVLSILTAGRASDWKVTVQQADRTIKTTMLPQRLDLTKPVSEREPMEMYLMSPVSEFQDLASFELNMEEVKLNEQMIVTVWDAAGRNMGMYTFTLTSLR